MGVSFPQNWPNCSACGKNTFWECKHEVEKRVCEQVRESYPLASTSLILLGGGADYIISSLCSTTMNFMGEMMRAPQIPFLTAKTLNTEGFVGRWPPLDRLVGVLTVFHMGMLFVHTLPWDGAVNGRVETIIRCTKNYNGQLVRNFLRDYRSRYCVVSECLRRGQPKAPIPQTPFVLWVRYRNNIDIVWQICHQF